MKQIPAAANNSPGRGAGGFGEHVLPQPDDPQLAVGYVTGVRMFDFGGPTPRGRHFLGSDEVGELSGNYGGRWADGECEAVCRNGHQHKDQVPSASCGCGFWAYWTADDAARVWRPTRPVMGVVEGYGPTRIGDIGFRSKLARIVALAVVFDFHIERTGESRDGWTEVFGSEPVPAGKNHELLAMAEDALGERYPSARVYSTTGAMLAMHPTSTEYLPNTARRNRWPGAALPTGRYPISTGEALDRMRAIEDAIKRQAISIDEARQRIDELTTTMQTLNHSWEAMMSARAHRPMPCQRCGEHATKLGQSVCDRCQVQQQRFVGQYMLSPVKMPDDWPGRLINFD